MDQAHAQQYAMVRLWRRCTGTAAGQQSAGWRRP